MSDSRESRLGLSYTLVTALAASFNLLVILVISFVLMPRVDRAVIEAERARVFAEENRALARKTQETLESNWRELEQHRSVIKRLTEILDANAAAAKAKAKAKK